jgi:chromosome partitioning protein
MDMTARRLVVAMPKGGSGKTATSVAFAWGLQRAGRRVLVVDLDSQGNATAALGVDAQPGGYGVLEFLLRPELPFEPQRVREGLEVVPACPWAVGVDLEVQRANQLTGPVAVREALERVEDRYDFIICDCAPSLGPVTYNALAAGPILAPVETTRLAVSVLPELGRVVQQLRRGVAPNASVLAYLPTRFVEEQTESREALKALEGLVGDRALRTRIPLATAIARSLAEGVPLYDARYRPSKGPPAYLAALDELLTIVEASHG